MKSTKVFLALIPMVFSFVSCDCGRVPIAPNIEEQSSARTESMLSCAQRASSNSEKWIVVNENTLSLMDSSTFYQTKIEELLKDKSLSAYKEEREAFSEWYAFQSDIASNVVSEIWELYIGGSAGGSMELRHLYDRANTDLTEQEILYNALIKKEYAGHFQSDASMEDIASAKDSLLNELQSAYSIIGQEDNGRCLARSGEEVAQYISRDFALFQKWMAARKELYPLLDSALRDIYLSSTAYSMNLYLRCIKGKYINEFE